MNRVLLSKHHRCTAEKKELQVLIAGVYVSFYRNNVEEEEEDVLCQ